MSRLYDVLFLTQNPILSWVVYTVHCALAPDCDTKRLLNLELVEDIQKQGMLFCTTFEKTVHFSSWPRGQSWLFIQVKLETTVKHAAVWVEVARFHRHRVEKDGGLQVGVGRAGAGRKNRWMCCNRVISTRAAAISAAQAGTPLVAGRLHENHVRTALCHEKTTHPAARLPWSSSPWPEFRWKSWTGKVSNLSHVAVATFKPCNKHCLPLVNFFPLETKRILLCSKGILN